MKLYGKNTIRSTEKLLKELQKIRKHGYAIDNEEYYEGVRCVAAPIISRRKVVAAVSVTGSIFTMSMDRINRQIISWVKETAQKISAELPA
jgi:DNA-binding IclR family transcriptional regulator